jgi:hypothetical protein
MEGIGYDFYPKTCDRTTADKWLKSSDKESFAYARKLIKNEGLLVGGSSGACLWGAMQVAKGLPKDKRVVCVFNDSIRNYLTKFVNDDWLLENNLLDQEEYDSKYINHESVELFGGEEKVEKVPRKIVKAMELVTKIQDCLKAFEEYKTDYVIKFSFLYFY